MKKRGVVLKENQTLAGLYAERVPLYKKYADITVNEHRKTIEKTIETLVDVLEEEYGVDV